MVSDGRGFSELVSILLRIPWVLLWRICVYVFKGDQSRDWLWGGNINGAYPRLIQSLVIDFHCLNTSNDSQKK